MDKPKSLATQAPRTQNCRHSNQVYRPEVNSKRKLLGIGNNINDWLKSCMRFDKSPTEKAEDTMG